MIRRSMGALLALVLALALAGAALVQAGVATTRHNLSISGPGTIKSGTEDQLCVFCHAPHSATPGTALWNRQSPTTAYQTYSSSTTKASVGQPTRGSLMCLSCHDGTIALGQVLNRTSPISMAGGITTLPVGSRSRLGTDLSGDHPISFNYSSSLASTRGELLDPSLLTGLVRVDTTGQLQCSSCHDAHNDANGKFLVMSNTNGALCVACHVKSGWSAGSHALSTRTWNGAGTNPWPNPTGTTVAANACGSCHRPHTAPGKKWLQHYAAEETNCYVCHNGNAAAKNIQAEFNKASIHPVAANTGVHDAGEANVVNTRHVECADCHDPHAANGSTGALPGSLTGVRGVNIAGADVNPATAEHQICFRCHGDSLNKPAPKTTRWSPQGNTRLDFQPTNKSCHPVAGACPTVNPAPVLVAPWTVTSTMTCDNCHNNNAGPGNGGTGPKGPHGSTNPSLLERSYTGGRPAMCAKCHTTTFTKFNGGSSHSKHTGDIGATCNTCHDPHGSSKYPSLINFDRSEVTSFTSFTPSTPGNSSNGNCTLTCHGKNHGSSCNYNSC